MSSAAWDMGWLLYRLPSPQVWVVVSLYGTLATSRRTAGKETGGGGFCPLPNITAQSRQLSFQMADPDSEEVEGKREGHGLEKIRADSQQN